LQISLSATPISPPPLVFAADYAELRLPPLFSSIAAAISLRFAAGFDIAIREKSDIFSPVVCLSFSFYLHADS